MGANKPLAGNYVRNQQYRKTPSTLSYSAHAASNLYSSVNQKPSTHGVVVGLRRNALQHI